MTILTRSALFLMPLSMLLLGILRIGQQASGIASLFGVVNEDFLPQALKPYSCTHQYTIEFLSIDPVIFYINGFLKEVEVEYLLNLKKNNFDTSAVYDKNLKSVVDTRYRTSQSAMVPRDDPVSVCLSERLKSLLGNIQHVETEPIQIVKYEPNERFRTHLDWFQKPRNKTYNPDMPYRPYNRLATIFAYLEDDCTGGETYFPQIQGVSGIADGDKFSRTDQPTGLLVRPRKGNAVFWNNLYPNGSGDPRVAHAGLPVKSGRKIGINLFSHYYLDSPMLGGDEE